MYRYIHFVSHETDHCSIQHLLRRISYMYMLVFILCPQQNYKCWQNVTIMFTFINAIPSCYTYHIPCCNVPTYLSEAYAVCCFKKLTVAVFILN